MSSPHQVAVVVGSLREASLSRMLAQSLPHLAPPTMQLRIVPIGDLPHYNQDLDTATPPASWSAFRAQVRDSDAILFVTPEYNRSVPGVLKNALDVGSRPFGKSVWQGKPSAVATLSPGMLGGAAAGLHLRQILAVLDIPTLPHPEVYLSNADNLFDASGALTNEGTRGFLSSFLRAFDAWIGKLS